MYIIIIINLYLINISLCDLTKLLSYRKRNFTGDVYEVVPDSYLFITNNSFSHVYGSHGNDDHLYCLPNKFGLTRLYKNILAPLIRHKIQWQNPSNKTIFAKSNKTVKYELVGGSTLKIRKLESEDTGVYRCTIRTHDGHLYINNVNLTIYNVASVGVQVPFSYKSNASCEYLMSVSLEIIAEINEMLCPSLDNKTDKTICPYRLYSECEEPLIQYLKICLNFQNEDSCLNKTEILDQFFTLLKLIILVLPHNFYERTNDTQAENVQSAYDYTINQAQNKMNLIPQFLPFFDNVSIDEDFYFEMIPQKLQLHKIYQYFCPEGFYYCFQCINSSVDHMCLPCFPGTANDDAFYGTCEKCPIDTFQFNYGAKVCFYCPENTGTKLRTSSTKISDCTRKYPAKSVAMWFCYIMVMVIVGTIFVIFMLGLVVILSSYFKFQKTPLLTLEDINDESTLNIEQKFPRKRITKLQKLQYLSD